MLIFLSFPSASDSPVQLHQYPLPYYEWTYAVPPDNGRDDN
jgi:hypothetical protein